MPLDPRLLLSFVVLAEELHFGRAAERLNLAQPGLSQQIQRLEEQVGSSLYTRTSRAVELTDAGRAMLEPARAALHATEQAERAAREAAETSVQPLRVGIDFFLEDVVPKVVAYEADHADLVLWVARMPEPSGQQALLAGHLDAFLGFLPPEDDGMTSRARVRGGDVPLLAVVRPDHPMARLAAVPLSTFRQATIVFYARKPSPQHYDYLVDVLSEGQGRKSLSVHELRPTGADARPAMLAEVTTGRAVGLASSMNAAGAHDGVRLLPFDPSLTIPTYVSWHANRSAATNAFVNYMTGA